MSTAASATGGGEVDGDRDKYRILFLNHAPNRDHMADMAELFKMSFMGPLAETDHAEFEMLWVGPWMDPGDEPLDWLLFRRCLEFRPDAVFVYGWWLYPDEDLRASTVSLCGLYLIRRLLNIKVAALLFDQARQHFAVSDILTSMCDWVFTHEHPSVFRAYSDHPDKHLITTATFSPSLFHGDPEAERDIDICFVGGTAGYMDERKKALDFLRAKGIEVTVPGGRGLGQKRLTNPEYADFIKRSKIVINWSRHISGKWFQPKARIFETTLAGSMLLCEECEPVNMWLRPNVDYAPFSTAEELAERADHYLRHEPERRRIAAQGHDTAMRTFSADILWGRMVASMRDGSLFRSEEALASLRRNASAHELRVARFFREALQGDDRCDAAAIDDVVEVLGRGQRSFATRTTWARRRWGQFVKRTRARLQHRAIRVLGPLVPRPIRRFLRQFL